MSRIDTEQQEVPRCPLQELVSEVRLVQEKLGRVIAGQKDIAETLSRAADRLRTMAVARN
ncbi:MAG TPA: hypothetical protein VFH22_15350 [Rhodocyclaceae bacterium]|nr:hypothetical protein [Rhodocyclaceae bacterium]